MPNNTIPTTEQLSPVTLYTRLNRHNRRLQRHRAAIDAVQADVSNLHINTAENNEALELTNADVMRLQEQLGRVLGTQEAQLLASASMEDQLRDATRRVDVQHEVLRTHDAAVAQLRHDVAGLQNFRLTLQQQSRLQADNHTPEQIVADAVEAVVEVAATAAPNTVAAERRRKLRERVAAHAKRLARHNRRLQRHDTRLTVATQRIDALSARLESAIVMMEAFAASNNNLRQMLLIAGLEAGR